MRMTLTHKFVGSLLIALSICALVVLWVSIHFMKEPLEEELGNNIRALQNVVRTANDQTASRFAQSAMLVSNDEALARAILERNHEEVMRLSQRAMKESGSDFMTVTDEKGTVVGRGHSKKFKDSVLNQETVVKALEGTPAAAIVAGTVVPFTIRASQPVKLDGKLVGTLSIGTSLVTPPYLDWLKKMTGMDITIFRGNERVMTTIMKDGQRIVGTKLDDPVIEGHVLTDGKTHFVENTINGVEYESAYWPVRTADGTIAGMWFVGTPISALRQHENAAIYKTVYVTLGVLLALLLLSLLVGLKISAPVRKITAYVMDVSEGKKDPQLDVHGNDDMGELAEALRDMVAKQDRLARENEARAKAAQMQAEEARQLEQQARVAHQEAIQAQRKGMVEAAARIESVVGNLNDAINSMAAQVEDSDTALRNASNHLASTSTAMEELNTTVNEVARNVSQAANMSANARSRAAEGSDVVMQSVNGMKTVHDQSMALKEDMETLAEHARSIDKIMSVISDIADQTNLLALNAAIEAARAGEAGRGFAVVADEVRKLAEKTMTSTTEVGSAIQAIQQSAGKSAQQVDRAVRHIAQANDFSNHSGEMLKEILHMVEQTADEVRSIATASDEQAATSEEITRSINEVNDITASTSGAMQVVANGLETLRARSRELVHLVEEMKRS